MEAKELMDLIKAKLERIDGEESDAVAMILDSRLDALMWEHRDLILRCVDTVAGIEKLAEYCGAVTVTMPKVENGSRCIVHGYKIGGPFRGHDLHSAVRSGVRAAVADENKKGA